MKKYVTISLFVFWAITVAVITAGLISINNNQIEVSGNNNIPNQTETNNTTGVNSNITTLNLSMTELAKHNSRTSCWILISGKIYDVTTFLNQHPGNSSTILPTCGTDATIAYNTRGGTGTHSSSATSLLAAYFIGNLNQNVTTNPNNPTTPPVANPNPVIPRGDDDDDD